MQDGELHTHFFTCPYWKFEICPSTFAASWNNSLNLKKLCRWSVKKRRKKYLNSVLFKCVLHFNPTVMYLVCNSCTLHNWISVNFMQWMKLKCLKYVFIWYLSRGVGTGCRMKNCLQTFLLTLHWKFQICSSTFSTSWSNF